MNISARVLTALCAILVLTALTAFTQSPGQVRARLIVAAQAEDTLAAPGNQQNCYLIMSVSDMSGAPVTGLTAANFKFDVSVAARAGGVAEIKNVVGTLLPGVYNVWVAPSGAVTWVAGDYVFAVAVQNGTGQGQTLARVTMD